MMDTKKFDIDNLILNTNPKIDFITWNIYEGGNISVDNKKDLNKILKECYKIYKNIYIITFSFGFEILLRLKLNKKIKKVSAWSPSFFYPQDNCKSLIEYNRDFYGFNKNNYIYKKLAHQLDKLDTSKYIKNIKFPVNIYLDKDDIKKHGSKEIIDFIEDNI